MVIALGGKLGEGDFFYFLQGKERENSCRGFGVARRRALYCRGLCIVGSPE